MNYQFDWFVLEDGLATLDIRWLGGDSNKQYLNKNIYSNLYKIMFYILVSFFNLRCFKFCFTLYHEVPLVTCLSMLVLIQYFWQEYIPNVYFLHKRTYEKNKIIIHKIEECKLKIQATNLIFSERMSHILETSDLRMV